MSTDWQKTWADGEPETDVSIVATPTRGVAPLDVDFTAVIGGGEEGNIQKVWGETDVQKVW